jgi:hypothetical protein
VSSPAVSWQRLLTAEIFSFTRSGPLVTAARAELFSTVNSTIAPSPHNLPCRDRLTGYPSSLLYNSSTRTAWTALHFSRCMRNHCRGNIFSEPLPRNGSHITLPFHDCFIETAMHPTVLRKFRVEISAQRSHILPKIFCDYLQFFQANVGIVTQITSRPRPRSSFSIYYSPIILQFDALQACLIKAMLHKARMDKKHGIMIMV